VGRCAQANGPVLARLRAMLTRRFVRPVVGQPHLSFDMSDVLDGGILLCRLLKGVLGDDTARLLGSFVVASVWQAATARSAQPEPARRDAVLVIDECQTGSIVVEAACTDLYTRTRDSNDAIAAVRSVLARTANPEHPDEVNVSRPSDALAPSRPPTPR
jgi:hypothetical protein